MDNLLERWLQNSGSEPLADDEWVAAFDADRQLVISKLGPYKRLFLRPENFTKRFFHQLYPVKIENWRYARQLSLFDGFCKIALVIDIRFQATLDYLLRNSELIESINAHIINSYADQVDDIVERQLEKLNDGKWVKDGLDRLEKQIVIGICELLTVQHIQAQALCSITAKFEEFPDVKPGKDNVYLQVLKKAFEVEEEKSQEQLRQQLLLEQQTLTEKAQHLEYLKQLTELELKAQALAAEKSRRLLAEKQDQLVQQLAIEKQIHAEQIRHQDDLQALEFDAELRKNETQQAKRRLSDIQQLTAQLNHEAEVERQTALAKLKRQELMRQLEASVSDSPLT